MQPAETESWSYRDVLAVLVADEIAHRKQTRLQRLTRKAHFPYFKTIDEFDFSFQTNLRLQMLGSFLAPDFVTEGRSLVLSGKPGRGKTHVAVAIAYRAIQDGFDALFITAAALIDDLSRASREGRLSEALATYWQPHVLVVDEVGYLTYGTHAANVLLHVVNERHLKKRSMIFTTNKPLKAWGKVLHDPDLAEAIVDRILERGRLVRLGGPSIRSRHVDLTADVGDAPDQDDGPDRVRFRNLQLVLSVHARRGFDRRCARCERKCRRFDEGDGLRRWRALDVGFVRSCVEAPAPRVKSPGHGVVVGSAPWARHQFRFTRSFEQQAA